MELYKIPEVKLYYVRDLENSYPVVSSAETLNNIFRESYEPGEMDDVEYFKVVYLAANLKPLGVHTVSMGSATASLVDMKTIYTGALLAKAQKIAVCHNHPSGNLRPSAEDENLTQRIKEAGKILGVTLVDHLIITSEGFYSFHSEGKI